MRHASESPERSPGEPEPLAAPSVRWVLGHIGRQQGLVEPNPRQGDQPHGDLDVLVVRRRRESAGAVGDAAQHAQQAELVGRALVVVQDDVPQQRQRARAVVGQPDCQLRPADLAAAEVVVGRSLALDERAVVPGEAPDLLGGRRDGTCAPASAGPSAQRDGQAAARLEERDQLAERPGPVAGRDVHPDRADQDEVEGETGPERALETRQRVGDPLDGRDRRAVRARWCATSRTARRRRRRGLCRPATPRRGRCRCRRRGRSPAAAGSRSFSQP